MNVHFYKKFIQKNRSKGTSSLCFFEFGNIAPAKLVKPGEVEKCEHEYIRHGTTVLIASRNVATGEIVMPMLNDTRTEKDFVQHISDVVGVLPEDKYIFIMDRLNTHQSEAMVRYVAKECGIKDYLGEKGKFGILKNMKSRQEFLES